jgi:hypothetical protein
MTKALYGRFESRSLRTVLQLADRTIRGISPDVAGAAIAQILTRIGRQADPNGSVPDHSNVIGVASSILKNLETKAS